MRRKYNISSNQIYKTHRLCGFKNKVYICFTSITSSVIHLSLVKLVIGQITVSEKATAMQQKSVGDLCGFSMVQSHK